METTKGYAVTAPSGEGVLVTWQVAWPKDDPRQQWEIEAYVEEDPDSLQPVIIKLQIRPHEYSARCDGIQSRMLRELTFTGALEEAKPYLPGADTTPGTGLVPIEVVREVVRREPRKRLRGEARRHALAFLAWAYEEAALAGDKPRKAVADALGEGWNGDKVKGQLRQAEKEGLFERTRPGQPGGRLTAAGELLVAERVRSLLAAESGGFVTTVGDGAAGVAALQAFLDRLPNEGESNGVVDELVADADGVRAVDDLLKERRPGVRVIQQ